MATELHRNVPFEDYLHWLAMSQSVLKQGRKSMLHLNAAICEVVTPTDAMRLGSALHTAFLEPDLFDGRVVEWSGKTRNGKAWDAFRADHAGQTILTSGYYRNVLGMVGQLRKNADVIMWAETVGPDDVEVSARGMIDGVLFKARVDALTAAPLWDLKTISSTERRVIDRAIYDYGYHIQAYIYTTVFERDRFILGFVESTAPYDVAVVELSDNWIEYGGVEARRLIEQFKACLETDTWPGRYAGSILADPPEWVAAKHDEPLMLGGKAI